LVKPLSWRHALDGGLSDAPGLADRLDRGGFYCLGLAALVQMGALVRGQLAAEPLIFGARSIIMSTAPYVQLEQEWRRLHAFHGALSLLRWDAAVMMPRGSADVRGEQLAALETEYHALLTTPKITRLLDRAQANSLGLEDWQLANLHEMRRQRDYAIATPVSLISRLARATARAEVQWAEARRQNNFDLLAPHLEEVVHLVRDKAALLG